MKSFLIRSPIIVGFLTYFLMSIFCYADPKLINKINHNVSIKICTSKSSINLSIHAIIQNDTENTINFSILGEFGNAIYIMHPGGRISMSVAALDLPIDFEYKPDFTVKPGDRLILDLDTYDVTSFLHPLLSRINESRKVGRYEIWFDLINWVDFRGNKFDKYTSNRIVFYVGADGEKTFINDPEAIQSFKEIGVEIGNSSAEVRVERTDEGNYRLIDTTNSNRFGNKIFSQFKTYSFIGWFALVIVALGISYYIWRSHSKRAHKL